MSGIYIGRGTVLTNRHVVVDQETALVHAPDGSRLEARVLPTKFSGDLVLLSVDGLDLGPPPNLLTEIESGDSLYVAAFDRTSGRVRLFARGALILPAAGDHRRSRLQHNAGGGIGSDGGAVISERGELVGIATAGTDKYSEAIPASRIKELIESTDSRHTADHRKTARQYRQCIDTQKLMPRRRARLSSRAVAHLSTTCDATDNVHLIDAAARILGRAGHVREAQDLFSRVLALDPHALSGRIGLVVMLHLSGGYGKAIPHLRWLMDVLPTDVEVMRLAIQAGKLGGDMAFARHALDRLKRQNPALALPMERFMNTHIPRRSE